MGRYKSRAWSYEKYRYNRYVKYQMPKHNRKSANLYDEVGEYLFKHDKSLDSLVTKLLNGDFEHLRYSDQ